MEKENKNKFWKGVLVGALVTAFSGLIIVGVATGISVIGRTVIDNQVQSRMIDGTKGSEEENLNLDMNRITKKVNTLQALIDRYYLFEKEEEDVEAGIYRGLMYGLDDPYSVYYDQEEFAQLMESTEGIYCGIGVMVSQDIRTKLTTVVRVFKDSPGQEAGMLPGDILCEVAGIDVTAMDLDLIVSRYIRGTEGTSVTIKVLRENDYVEMKVRRAQIEVPTVEHKMLQKDTGYVQVAQFDLITPAQFIKAIEDLESQGMKQLIIDLRGNPGGVLDAAVEMAAYLLPEDKLDGMIVYTEDKNGKGEKYFSKDGQLCMKSDHSTGNENQYPKKDGHQLDLPIAVLINGNSASASELFAGCLKDYDQATLVGTTTFGKGIVQNLIPLEDNSAIKLTTSRYFTASGYSIHEVGVEPDVEVELDEELQKKAVITPEEDNQIQKAIEVLETP